MKIDHKENWKHPFAVSTDWKQSLAESATSAFEVLPECTWDVEVHNISRCGWQSRSHLPSLGASGELHSPMDLELVRLEHLEEHSGGVGSRRKERSREAGNREMT